MAVVAFVNPKGGSGKTTLSMVLAEQYAKQGLSVALIDTDPNGFHRTWKDRRGEGMDDPGFEIMFEPEESKVISILEQAAEDYDIVLVDTEGTASKTVTRVISRTHLVIIPMNPGAMDAEQAGRAVNLIKDDAHMLGREIDFRLIFSRTKTVMSRSHKNLIEELSQAGLPVLSKQMHDRAAFNEIFEYSATIAELIADAQSDHAEAEREGRKTAATAADKKAQSHMKAAANAEAVAGEISGVLKAMMEAA